MRLLTTLFLSIFITVACNSSGGGSGTTDPTDTVGNTTGPNTPQGGDTGDGNATTGDNSGGSNTADPNCVEKLGLDKVVQDEVFIGANDWYSTAQLTDAMMKANAQATVYVRMSGARCSGFLVNDDTIMTNNHCIGNASEANGVYVRFDWVTAGGSYKQYTCDEFIGTSSSLDFTLVKCKGSPGKYHSQVVLADYQGKTGYPIYVTQQNCDYYSSGGCTPTQKISEGSLIGYSSTKVTHNADTLGGSSGSPVFDKDSHKVVAIHNAGSSSYQQNYGVQMYKIVDYIKDYMPQVQVNSSSSRAPAYDVCD